MNESGHRDRLARWSQSSSRQDIISRPAKKSITGAMSVKGIISCAALKCNGNAACAADIGKLVVAAVADQFVLETFSLGGRMAATIHGQRVVAGARQDGFDGAKDSICARPAGNARVIVDVDFGDDSADGGSI